MVTRAASVDLAEIAIDGVLHAAGGAVQRMAWEKGAGVSGLHPGMLTTGVMILGGLAVSVYGRGGSDIVRRLAQASFYSGVTIAGWLTAEKVLQLGQVGPGSESLPSGMEMSLPSYQFAGVPRAQAMTVDRNGNQEFKF